jgi:hypothetical protein
MESKIEEKRQNWQIIGYVLPVIKAPVLVKPVLTETTNPEKWFFAKDPNTDVRAEVESMPQKDKLGAPAFVKLSSPVKYNLYSVCIYLGDGNLVQSWSSKEVADFVENNYL